MHGKKSISVIIPCHNAAPWIMDAIKSVEAQTVKPKEILLVDDNCTDDSVERARSTGAKLELVSVSRNNAAAARNEGIRCADGEWIAFLDADDEWTSDHLERALKLMGEGDIAYLSTCRHRTASDRLNVIDFNWPAPWPRVPRSDLNRWHFIKWFSAGTAFCHSSLVVSRDVLKEVGGYDADLMRRHDYELFMRVICQGTWCFDPVPCVIYQRNTPNSISQETVECSYFFVKGLIKNHDAFKSPAMDALLHHQIRGAVRDALTVGSNQEIERVWKESKNLLSVKERSFLYLLKLVRPISKYLYRMKDAVGLRIR